jgi:translation initiation factor eIF-2B subunit beta
VTLTLMMCIVELVIGNVVRRVMHIIREEMQEEPEEELVDPVVLREVRPVAGGLSKALGKPSSTNSKTWGRSFSLHNLLDQLPEDESSSDERDVTQPLLYTESAEKRQLNKVSSVAWDRKQAVIDGVNELIEDLKEIDAAIALHASEHIHANEIILTFGFSRTVAQFLRRAREKRDFQTVVAEGAPTLQGHAMAAELARFGIRTTAIADAAIYAMMARVNKVVISAHALLADGGVMAPVGTAAVAIAAKRHNVPFVVLAGMYKLSPVFPHEPGVTFNDFKEPWEVLPFTDPASLAAQLAGNVVTSCSLLV